MHNVFFRSIDTRKLVNILIINGKINGILSLQIEFFILISFGKQRQKNSFYIYQRNYSEKIKNKKIQTVQ